MPTVTFRMDKLQGPNVQHREIYLIPCDNQKEYKKEKYLQSRNQDVLRIDWNFVALKTTILVSENMHT